MNEAEKNILPFQRSGANEMPAYFTARRGAVKQGYYTEWEALRKGSWRSPEPPRTVYPLFASHFSTETPFKISALPSLTGGGGAAFVHYPGNLVGYEWRTAEFPKDTANRVVRRKSEMKEDSEIKAAES